MDVPFSAAVSPRNEFVAASGAIGIGRFVGMEHVESRTGKRIGSAEIDLAKTSGSKQIFRRGDIVFGRLRPNLNKVWLAEFDGYCSVDQTVLVVRRGFDSLFVSLFMRSSRFRDQVRPLVRGELPRIRTRELLGLSIHAPSLGEQREIADRLNLQLTAADRIKDAANARLGTIPALRRSILNAVLAAAEPAPTKRLGDVSVFVTDGTHQPPPLSAAGVPFLFVRDIVGGALDLDRVRQFVSDETFDALTKRRRPERGDVLYSAVGSFGVAVEVDTDRRFTFQRHIAHVRPDRSQISPAFLAAVLNSRLGRSQSNDAAVGGAQKTVTLGALADFQIPVPGLKSQEILMQSLDARLYALEHLAQVVAPAIPAVAALSDALLSRSFTSLSA
ncbi:MAG TPA: hypothetical protein VJ850_07230 [Candidatus Limnocylindrales bacterium]|nr:hypothetical protein [Candidatus Limnocylindrales bacterium]